MTDTKRQRSTVRILLAHLACLTAMNATATAHGFKLESCAVTTYPIGPETSQKWIDLVKAYDPNADGELQDRFDSGEFKFCGMQNTNILASHDYDTIALDKNLPNSIIPIAILHELEHIKHCTHPPSIGDDRAGTPCYPCIHLGMNIDSWNQIKQEVCTTPPPDDKEQAQVCKSLGNLAAAMDLMFEECSESPPECDFPPNAPWNQEKCDYCDDNEDH